MEYSQVITQHADLTHDVCGEYHSPSIGSASAYEVDNASGGYYIQPRCWLVEYHNSRIVDDRSYDGNLLLHPGRELAYAPVGEGVHIEKLEQLLFPLPEF